MTVDTSHNQRYDAFASDSEVQDNWVELHPLLHQDQLHHPLLGQHPFHAPGYCHAVSGGRHPFAEEYW